MKRATFYLFWFKSYGASNFAYFSCIFLIRRQSWRKYLAKPARAPLPSINVDFWPVWLSTACSSPTLMLGGGVGEPKESKTTLRYGSFFIHVILHSIRLANIFPPRLSTNGKITNLTKNALTPKRTERLAWYFQALITTHICIYSHDIRVLTGVRLT